MLVKNRSVPTDSVLPHVVYRDVAAALAWLAATFGFIEHYRYGPSGGPVQGAQARLGAAWIMLEVVRDGRATPAQLGPCTQYLSVFVADVATQYDRARSAGAEIVEALNETVYGELQYVARDLDGHHWLFSQHVRDLNPADWGAVVADGAGDEPSYPTT